MSEETERKLTKLLNENKESKFWDKLNEIVEDRKNTFAIHIVKEKRSKILDKKVYPKADVALAKGSIDPEYLEENDYYLDEEDKQIFGLTFIPDSGISVKKPGSEDYTITKMNPSTFEKVFGSRELGAGASFYCLKKKDIEKNSDIAEGWGTSISKVKDYFDEIQNIEKLGSDVDKSERKSVFRKVKTEANEQIENMIEEDDEVSSFIFRGEENFREPFTAPWLYQDQKLEKNQPDSFHVTTGSGRSRGDFTIVIKP